MMKTLIGVMLLAGTIGTAAADDKLVLGTDVVKFDKATTEDQCAAKAKTAIAGAGFKDVSAVPHGMAGKATDYIVVVDCLQSWGFNGAHVSVAALAASKDKEKTVREGVVKALQAK